MNNSVSAEYEEAFGVPEAGQETSQVKDVPFSIGNTECCKHRQTSLLMGSGHSPDDCLDCGVVFDQRSEGKVSESEECPHDDMLEIDNGLFTCRNCSIETEIWSFAPEWRFYGSADNRVSKNPSRCHYSKGSGKGLESTFSGCEIKIPLAIKQITEKKYDKIVERLRSEKEKNTVRGMRKKSIVAACLLHTYQEFGQVRTATHIRDFFDLKQKAMSRGLLEYSKTFPEDRTTTTNPENLIQWQMRLSGIHKDHYEKILTITKYLKGTSQILLRSNPQSVSAAILYFYLCLNLGYKKELGLTKKQFAERVNLSDITITKLVHEAARVSRCQIQV